LLPGHRQGRKQKNGNDGGARSATCYPKSPHGSNGKRGFLTRAFGPHEKSARESHSKKKGRLTKVINRWAKKRDSTSQMDADRNADMNERNKKCKI